MFLTPHLDPHCWNPVCTAQPKLYNLQFSNFHTSDIIRCRCAERSFVRLGDKMAELKSFSAQVYANSHLLRRDFSIETQIARGLKSLPVKLNFTCICLECVCNRIKLLQRHFTTAWTQHNCFQWSGLDWPYFARFIVVALYTVNAVFIAVLRFAVQSSRTARVAQARHMAEVSNFTALEGHVALAS